MRHMLATLSSCVFLPAISVRRSVRHCVIHDCSLCFSLTTVLNTLLTNAKIVLQLSLREGFEVKVSESLHHGKPTIATRAGGIPLQIIDGKSGFLVDVHDTTAVANHLYNLWTDKALYDRISAQAAVNVSDEVGTCGNLASWLYLASKLSKGEKLKPNGRWINDMMREDAGVRSFQVLAPS